MCIYIYAYMHIIIYMHIYTCMYALAKATIFPAGGFRQVRKWAMWRVYVCVDGCVDACRVRVCICVCFGGLIILQVKND